MFIEQFQSEKNSRIFFQDSCLIPSVLSAGPRCASIIIRFQDQIFKSNISSIVVTMKLTILCSYFCVRNHIFLFYSLSLKTTALWSSTLQLNVSQGCFLKKFVIYEISFALYTQRINLPIYACSSLHLPCLFFLCSIVVFLLNC